MRSEIIEISDIIDKSETFENFQEISEILIKHLENLIDLSYHRYFKSLDI